MITVRHIMLRLVNATPAKMAINFQRVFAKRQFLYKLILKIITAGQLIRIYVLNAIMVII